LPEAVFALHCEVVRRMKRNGVLGSRWSRGLLAEHGGPQAAGWNADGVRAVFRQGLCSLASQLIQASAARG
jgi:hypothetical protein